MFDLKYVPSRRRCGSARIAMSVSVVARRSSRCAPGGNGRDGQRDGESFRQTANVNFSGRARRMERRRGEGRVTPRPPARPLPGSHEYANTNPSARHKMCSRNTYRALDGAHGDATADWAHA